MALTLKKLNVFFENKNIFSNEKYLQKTFKSIISEWKLFNIFNIKSINQRFIYYNTLKNVIGQR